VAGKVTVGLALHWNYVTDITQAVYILQCSNYLQAEAYKRDMSTVSMLL